MIAVKWSTLPNMPKLDTVNVPPCKKWNSREKMYWWTNDISPEKINVTFTCFFNKILNHKLSKITDLEFLRLQLSFTRSFCQFGNFAADSQQAFGVGVKNNWSNQTNIGAHCNWHINGIVLADKRVHEERIGFGNAQTSKSTSFDDKVINRKFVRLGTIGSFFCNNSVEFFTNPKKLSK